MNDLAANPPRVTRIPRLTSTGAFTALCVGQMASVFGSHLTSFVLGVWIYQQTHSATNFALVSFFAIVPEVLLSPLAGAMVDRWDRRWLMIAGNFGAALAVFTLILIALSGRVALWPAYAIVAASSAFQAIQYPALSASTPLLVPARHLSRANGAVEFGNALALVVSPLVAALFLASIGFKGIFVLNVCAFAFAILALLAAEIPGPAAVAETKRSGLLQQAAEGWTYIKVRREFLGLLLLFATINFAFGTVQVLLPPLVLSFASSLSLGTVMSCAGAGLMVGSLAISILGAPRRKIRVLLLLALLQGLVLFLGVLQLSVALVSGAVFVFSVCTIMIFVISQTIWQTQIPQAIQGRAFAVRRLISWSTLPVAYLTAGPLADKVFEPLMAERGGLASVAGPIMGTGPGRGIALLFLLMGAAMVLAVASASRYRPFWELEARILTAGHAAIEDKNENPAAGDRIAV